MIRIEWYGQMRLKSIDLHLMDVFGAELGMVSKYKADMPRKLLNMVEAILKYGVA